MLWNDPQQTLPLASYTKPEPRRSETERRLDERRAALGERRTTTQRVLRALLRM
ncbi:MAG: hypothetical protein M3Y87_14450 [Myxococcota bacterium]|nr:hypothetical protein [Myxococcota bacterium]